MVGQQAYEVFIKAAKENTYSHVGSVRAPNPEFALEWAAATYARRTDARSLWVVPRACVTATSEEQAALLRADPRKAYRQPGFFTRRRRDLVHKVESLIEHRAEADQGGIDP
jgi:ring-1,2-phenylacetyl-CoA epoxidase subunit PaaB